MCLSELYGVRLDVQIEAARTLARNVQKIVTVLRKLEVQAKELQDHEQKELQDDEQKEQPFEYAQLLTTMRAFTSFLWSSANSTSLAGLLNQGFVFVRRDEGLSGWVVIEDSR